MKRLFDDLERYSDAANAVDERTSAALRGIMQEFVDEGFSPRDVAAVMRWAVCDLELVETSKLLPRSKGETAS